MDQGGKRDGSDWLPGFPIANLSRFRFPFPSSTARRVPPLKADRMLVLTLPDSALLDGLLQHPDTRPWLGDRLGPSAVTISDEHLEPLREALKEFGIALDGE